MKPISDIRQVNQGQAKRLVEMTYNLLAVIDSHLAPNSLIRAERVLSRVGKVTQRLSNLFEVQTNLEPSRVHAALRNELDSDAHICVAYAAVICAS